MTTYQADSAAEQSALTRARMILVAVVVPLVTACAAALMIVSWLPTLPPEIAMHWGAQGVDGVGSPWQLIAILLGTVGLFAGVMAFSVSDLGPHGRPKMMHKALAVTSLWLAVTLSVGIAGSVATQRGLVDVMTAPDPAPWLLLGAGLGLVVAAGAWFVLPQADRAPHETLPLEPLEMRSTELIYWTGTVTVNQKLRLLLLSVMLLAVASVTAAAYAGGDSIVLILIVAIAVLGLILMISRWRVSAGQHGMTVASFAGWPAFRIPLSDIDAAQLIEVNPIGDFGGWGWRWAGSRRSGLILQSGPAIEITRSNGAVLVVPIDDAATAVAVLQALLSQPTISN